MKKTNKIKNVKVGIVKYPGLTWKILNFIHNPVYTNFYTFEVQRAMGRFKGIVMGKISTIHEYEA